MAKWLTLILLSISLSFSVEILSRHLSTDEEGNIVASGEVEAQYREYVIRADRVRYNPKTKEIYAYGNVYIRRKDGTFEVLGKEAYIDLKSEKGYFLDAEGRFRSFYFSAKRVEKVGEDSYNVYDGDVTTCPPDRKELKVCFWKAHVSDRYVFSFSNSMKFFEVPFFYSPVVVFPVGERRSGLLPPMIGSNSYNSFIYIQPVFWAISRDKDATLTFDYRDKQAKGIQLEYRQAFTEKERLFFRVSYYKEPRPPGEWWEGRSLRAFRENRFRIELGTGIKELKLGLDLPSDPYFFEDVYFSQERRTVPYTLSYITYTRLDREYLLSFNLRNYYDLTSDSNDRTLNLLPELGFYLRPKRVSSMFVSLTSTFSNFQSEKEETTKRFIFTPQAELPMKLFGLNNYARIEFVNNFYFTEGEFSDVRVNTLRFEDRLPLFHSLLLKGVELSNILEFVYTFSPKNFDNPQLDGFDEVTKENNLKLRYSSSVNYSGRTVASFFLEGGYNMLSSYRFPTDGELVEKSLLPFRAILSLYPVGWFSLSEDATYDANLGVLARSVSSASVKVKNLSLRGSYVVSKDSRNRRTSDQYSLSSELGWRMLIVGGSVTRDNITEKELYRKVYLGLRGACWALKVDYSRTYYGTEKGYLREVFVVFNIFNMRDFKLPLRRR